MGRSRPFSLPSERFEPLGLSNALARRLARADSGERVTVGGLEYEPSSIARRHDVRVEPGLTEREFVEAILVVDRGRVRQRALTYYIPGEDDPAGPAAPSSA